MTDKFIPGKRIKTWHRHHIELELTPLRPSLLQFARSLITNGTEREVVCATKWARGKAVPK